MAYAGPMSCCVVAVVVFKRSKKKIVQSHLENSVFFSLSRAKRRCLLHASDCKGNLGNTHLIMQHLPFQSARGA